MPAASPGDAAHILATERAHLTASRDALARMRERADALFSGAVLGGDAVSTQYLKQSLYRRMRSLEADPDTPLFFGRLDRATAAGAEHDESLYIGRRHVAAESGGEPLVIDWRAPLSLPFYRARPGEPMGVRVRRRFGFAAGSLTAFEDEDLLGGTPGDDHSAILEAEIERPRTGPMRDIVATIQPEQDVLVRTDLAASLCIQGAPGTGKTAVGLHRAAYLLYAFREQLARSGVLVVGPNNSFLSYIGDVLPALGEIDAGQATVDSLLASAHDIAITGVDEPAAAMIKTDPRMAEVIETAIWSRLGEPDEPLVVPRGSRQFRVGAYLIAETVAELRGRGTRYEAAREMLPQRLAHQVLLRMEAGGDSPDDRVQAAVARSRPVKEYAKRLWPAQQARQVIFDLLADPAALAAAAEGILTPEEQRLILWSRPPRSVRSARWTAADLALVDEAADRLHRTPSLGHLILDEAQDLSPMQLRAVGRRASTGSVTVLGDLAQATTPWASRDWASALGHLGQPTAAVTELVAGFRVPAAVIDFAARLLPTIAPGLRPPHAVRRSGGLLRIEPTDDPTGRLGGLVAELAELPGTIGVIAADADADAIGAALTAAGIDHRGVGDERDWESRVDLVPAGLAKGLEFDQVIVIEPAAIVAGEADRPTGLRRLYVTLTRAVSALVVVHRLPLPEQLVE